MNEFRALIAVIVFSISSYFIYDLSVNGFNWSVLIACILGYVSVHYIWPEKSEGESLWYEILEYIMDLPFKAISMLLRTIGRSIRKADDLDVDL